MRDPLTSAWETILDASKHDDGTCDFEGVEEQQVDPGPTPEDTDDFIATMLQEVIGY